MTRRRKIPLKKKRTELPPIQCLHCHSWFIPKDRRYKFDKEDCRIAWQKEHYWPKMEWIKVCLKCGKEFRTTKPKLQNYCPGGECREAAALERRVKSAELFRQWKESVAR